MRPTNRRFVTKDSLQQAIDKKTIGMVDFMEIKIFLRS